jgi:hypothetical protein
VNNKVEEVAPEQATEIKAAAEEAAEAARAPGSKHYRI